MVSTPFVTRIYTPTDLGLFGVFVSFLTFASVGATLRYDLAIVSCKNEHEANVLLLAAFGIAVPYVTLALIVFLEMIHYDLLRYGALPPWSAVGMAIALLGTALFTALRFWYVGRKRFGEISLAQIYQGAGRAALPLIMGVLSFGWSGLVCGEIAGRVLGGTKLVQSAWLEVRSTLRELDRAECMRILRKYWKYPAVFLPSSVIDTLATSLPLPVISALFGIASAGQYFLVYRLATAPSALISAGVADVLHARLTDAAKTDKVSVRRIMMGATKKLFFVGLAIYIPAALVSPFLFPFVFGHSWKVAGTLMAIQSLASISGLVVSPLSRAFAISRHPEYKFIADICRAGLPVSSLIVAHQHALGFIAAMAIFCSLSVLSELLYLLVIWHSTSLERQISFTEVADL